MMTTQASRPAQRWFTVMDGHRLRRLRCQRGLSQEQLAARAGISSATVARLDLLTEPRDVVAVQKADRPWPGTAMLSGMS
jgi:DNA-binding transcriptional regulator LsrR (DeoR family)